MQKEFLFVCGCPRSGTSYLATLLLASPDVAIGMERFPERLLTRRLTPSDFEASRFLEVRPGDTFYESLDFFPDHAKQLRARCETARYVGDKVPRAYERLDWLAEQFSPIKLVVMFRDISDVAASYEARRQRGTLWPADWGVSKAIEHWNAAIAAVLPWMTRPNLLPIEYEALTTDPSIVLRLAEFLAVDPAPMTKMWEIQRRYGPAQLSGRGIEQLAENDLALISKAADLDGLLAVRARARAVAGWIS